MKISSTTSSSTTIVSAVKTASTTVSSKAIAVLKPPSTGPAFIPAKAPTPAPAPSPTPAPVVTRTPTPAATTVQNFEVDPRGESIFPSPGPIVDDRPTAIPPKTVEQVSSTPGIPLSEVIYSFPGVTKAVLADFEKTAQNFSQTSPQILNLIEYVVDGVFVGVLIVWKKFLNSTHYELFKKNLFREYANYERILFLDTVSLTAETDRFYQYVKDLGFVLNKSDIYIVLDTLVKDDRIYEYKIKANYLPSKVTEIDYDFILESKNLLQKVSVERCN